MDEKSSFTWFVGLFEGEGTFHFTKGRPRGLVISMTDLDVLRRVQEIVGGSIYDLTKREEHWKDAWKWRIGGQAAKDLAEKMLPYLGNRRAERCKEFIDLYYTQEDYNLERKIKRAKLIESALVLRAANKTHAEIAKELGCDRSYISKILKNPVSHPISLR